MSEINTKMRVTGINEYKNAMKQGQQAVKTLDAELKLNEAQYKASGDAEAYMQQKSKLLTDQIKQQRQIVDNATKALRQMEKDGVSKTSAAYQKMQQDLANAQTSLLGMETSMSTVGSAAEKMGQKTDKATSALQSIDKKVSFQTVISGISKITEGIDKAISKAGQMAREVWNTMATTASWADSENTLAAMYGIDVETLQRMQGASRTIDTSVDAIIGARKRLATAMYNEKGALKELGIETVLYGESEYSHNKIIAGYRDMEDVFWEIGDALMAMDGAEKEVQRDALAQQIFGRSWNELMPLFKAGREEYEKTLEAQSIVTEENVNKLNELDDSLQKLDQEFQTLKTTVLATLAPAFTTLADSFSGVLQQFNEYLATDEGKEKMQGLADAVSQLFSGVSDINFDTAMETVTTLVEDLVGGLKWISENKGGVIAAFKTIIGALGTMKLIGGGLQLLNLVNGAKNLFGGGSSNTTTTTTAPTLPTALVTNETGSQVAKTMLSGLSKMALIATIVDTAVLETWKQADPLGEKYAEEYVQGKLSTDPSFFFSNYPKFDTAAEKIALNIMQKRMEQKALELVNFQFEDEDLFGWREADSQALFRERVNELMSSWIYPFESGTAKNHITGSGKGKLLPGESVKGIGPVLGEDVKQAAEETKKTITEKIVDFINMSFEDDEVVPSFIEAESRAIFQVRMNDMLRSWLTDPFGGRGEGEGGGPVGIFQTLHDELEQGMAERPIEVPVEAGEPAAFMDNLQQKINSFKISVPVYPELVGGDTGRGAASGGGQLMFLPDIGYSYGGREHANGMPWVPFDGYPAILHRGERVLTANENNRYMTNNSNLFVEHMHMNGGLSARALADQIAAAQRRMTAGYGS